jgi:hypothetical protein
MGCTCTIKWGDVPEPDSSNLILKVMLTKVVEEQAEMDQNHDKNFRKSTQDEVLTSKPDFVYPSASPQFKPTTPDSFRPDASLTLKPSTIIQEGELQKYRPGFTNQTISRWCVLTEYYFMYYKNRASAQIWTQSPLYSVPLSEIKTVEK